MISWNWVSPIRRHSSPLSSKFETLVGPERPTKSPIIKEDTHHGRLKKSKRKTILSRRDSSHGVLTIGRGVECLYERRSTVTTVPYPLPTTTPKFCQKGWRRHGETHYVSILVHLLLTTSEHKTIARDWDWWRQWETNLCRTNHYPPSVPFLNN